MTQIANFSVKVAQGKFEAGTVGGEWMWVLNDNGVGTPETRTTEWTTAEAYTSIDIEPGDYKITCQRLDEDSKGLGPLSSTGFTVEDGETPPEVVYIDVSDSVVVTITDAPVAEPK